MKQSRIEGRNVQKERRRAEAERRLAINRKLSPIKNKLSELEARIEELEKREAELSSQLADPEIYANHKKSGPLLMEYNEVRRKLEELLGRWEYQHKLLEETKRQLGGD